MPHLVTRWQHCHDAFAAEQAWIAWTRRTQQGHKTGKVGDRQLLTLWQLLDFAKRFVEEVQHQTIGSRASPLWPSSPSVQTFKAEP